VSRNRIGLGLLGAALAGALALTACGAGGSAQNLHNSTQLATKTLDINQRDPATLVDGNFVWPLDFWLNNWNGNEVDGTDENAPPVYNAFLPRFFLMQPDGTPVINHDYLLDAKVTSTSPQVVTYDINPKAHWSDGNPLTWQDLQTQWQALNGSNPAFEAANPIGYDDISSITRGSSPTQAVVTFDKPFAEWQYLFSQYSPLYPPSVNATPAAFNTSLLNGPPTISAGPFVVQSADKNKQTVVMVRNPQWWGAKPVLSKIIYQVVSRGNRADALANGEITFTPLFANADLYKRAQQMPNVAIRESVADNFNDIWFNGRPGATLSDLKLRRAVAEGIDPTAFTKAQIGTIEPNPVPIGDHLYLPGTKNHQDHTNLLRYNTSQAKKDLDADGWTQAAGQKYRSKDGKELDLSILDASDSGDPTVVATDNLLISQLQAIGVNATLNAVPETKEQDNIDKGNWDLTPSGWIISPFAISSTANAYEYDPKNVAENYSQIGNDTINKLYDQANSTLDDTQRAKLGNQIDSDLWQEAIDVPLFQSPGVRLVNKDVANFGAFGFADIDYTKIGFVKK
jgi:peptide/nickel transport system substrate-binding protein